MSDLKTLRNRIKSIKKTQKITKAMKMVAASKLRKARQEAEQARLFTENVREDFFACLTDVNDSDELGFDFFKNQETKKVLLVLVSTDRGLCGGLNTNLIRYCLNKAKKIKDSGKDCKILCIGKKGRDIIKSKSPGLVYDFVEGFSSRKIDVESIANIRDCIFNAALEEHFQEVRLIVPVFVSAITQNISDTLFLASRDRLLEENNKKNIKVSKDINKYDFEYEPNKTAVISELFKYYVFATLQQDFYETFASEQGARMTAMDNAINNCSDLIDKITLKYNRTRQSKITTELIEIIAATEAI